MAFLTVFPAFQALRKTKNDRGVCKMEVYVKNSSGPTCLEL